MISGKTHLLLPSLLLTLCASASASESVPAVPATHALIAALGQPAPAHTAFAEARFLQILQKPLVVSGELSWLGGDQLQRRVDQPQRETATIADGEVTQQREGKSARHFSLKRAPQLQVLLDSFVALLSGDAERLQKSFEITQAGNADGAWSLTLVPRDARVAKTVASIRIDGAGNQSRCMHMQEADGDVAVDLLGPLATKMPAEPTREALQALCQSAP
ncbi:outer membrane lipoprotein carrier protein LolA [Rhodanobacter sp. AS-Z3]|uniref:LolA-related protein n=1 Tax=Rhodanobacter sp. AS-Z3 TaxID=3031330 RepID=UPI0024799D73|nr:LolA-related protein [Rhodanobacter sp. AS-Z3]WEN15337.1 outer membrane lipoprotein carrier protein LolA [Rhodanobacter sp. AS-Z3]